MDFSSLVIMQKDKETGYLIKELGSYQAGDGAKYVTKLHETDGDVILYFDTNRDVSEWEYSAIYDLLDYDLFRNSSLDIEDVDDEYNPSWKVILKYKDEHNEMKEDLDKVCSIIEEAMDKVFNDIQGKEEEYK